MKLKNNRIVIYITLQIVVALLYYLGSVITVFETNLVPLTIIDDYVKPHFLAVWIYMSFFLLLALAVYLSNKKNMLLYVKMMLFNSIISLLCFILYPTYIIHQDYSMLKERSPISYDFLSFVIDNDVRSNCFPSLHIANSLLGIIFLFKLKNKYITFISCLWFILIGWSVLSTGQHYFYDILGGILLTLISYYVITSLTCSRIKRLAKTFYFVLSFSTQRQIKRFGGLHKNILNFELSTKTCINYSYCCHSFMLLRLISVQQFYYKTVLGNR